MKNIKPLGSKSYGSIAHLPNSRLGPGDHKITEGQARIATYQKRDRHDLVVVQEKLDGSNVGVALINGEIIPLTRSGYVANTSPYEMHHRFYDWVGRNEDRFRNVLFDGERVCGEWLEQAHGTRYRLPHEPFVAFDIMFGGVRTAYDEFLYRVLPGDFIVPHEISRGDSVSIDCAMSWLNGYGFHGAIDEVEGAVWRVERKGRVDFLCKYVRPEKVDGIYLNGEPILNEWV